MFAVLILKERRVRGLMCGARGSGAEDRYLRQERYWKRPWVARIVGVDQEFGFEREFVIGFRDYAHSTGAMGITKSFFLDDGYYEVKEIVSAKRERRYFAKVANGDLVEVTRSEVEAFAHKGSLPCP